MGWAARGRRRAGVWYDPGLDRADENGGAKIDHSNAPPLFACACPHNRQAGSMNPRVAGFPGAVTAILRMLHPAR